MNKLLVVLKTFLAKRMAIIEFCRDCGCRVNQVWHADDALWLRLNDKKSNGCLCIACFDKRAELHGCLIRWEAKFDVVIKGDKWDPYTDFNVLTNDRGS